MNPNTRRLFMAFVSGIALAAGAADAKEQFTATPSQQQSLVDKVQLSSAFLQRINMVLVPEMTGEIIGLGISGTIAGRTNTDTTDRLGADPTVLDNRGYVCKFTEFDIALKWAKLDMWAKFKDFQKRISNMCAARIALDLIMIGWNGTSAAVATNRGTNPLLQDVNIGWLEKQRTENAARTMTGAAVALHVTYGTHAAADYKTLDALVYDAKQLLPEWTRESTALVAIVGSDLLHDKYFPMINSDEDPTEQLARDVIMSTKRLGGMPAVVVPHFPAGKVFITTFDNLSIYEQEGKHRRHIQENPKRSRTDDFQSGNYAYVIEDLDYAVLVENIELKNAA